MIMRVLSLLVLLPQCILGRANDDENSSSLRPPNKALSSSSSTNVAANLQSDSEISQFGEGAYLVNDVESFSGEVKAPSGISILRSIDTLADDLSLVLTFVNAICEEQDDNGGNKCHYNWGDDLNITITLDAHGNPFKKGDGVKGKFKVDYIVPWKFDCQVCGEDCVLSIPVVNAGTTIPGPDCPFANEAHTIGFELPLDNGSPVAGIPTHFSGHVTVKRSDIVVVRISVEATVV